jgi:hypothetical protein
MAVVVKEEEGGIKFSMISTRLLLVLRANRLQQSLF